MPIDEKILNASFEIISDLIIITAAAAANKKPNDEEEASCIISLIERMLKW